MRPLPHHPSKKLRAKTLFVAAAAAMMLAFSDGLGGGWTGNFPWHPSLPSSRATDGAELGACCKRLP